MFQLLQRSVELHTREEYNYSSGLIPSNTADELAKLRRYR